MDEKILCPICEKDDRIESVTAARAKEVTHGMYGTTSELGRLLTPPGMPTPKTYPFWEGCAITIGWLFVLMPGAALTKGKTTTLGAFIMVGSFVVYWFIIKARKREFNKQHEDENIRASNRWKAAMRLYESAYYCHKDGVVFLPAIAMSCKPEGLESYLYSQVDSAS